MEKQRDKTFCNSVRPLFIMRCFMRNDIIKLVKLIDRLDEIKKEFDDKHYLSEYEVGKYDLIVYIKHFIYFEDEEK